MARSMSPDRQQQLKRVLDRVQQLPILPGSTIKPPARREGRSEQPSTKASELPPGIAGTAGGSDGNSGLPGGQPRASGPWLLAFAPTLSAVVAAGIATAATLYFLKGRPPPPQASGGLRQELTSEATGTTHGPVIERSVLASGPPPPTRPGTGNEPVAVPEAAPFDLRMSRPHASLTEVPGEHRTLPDLSEPARRAIRTPDTKKDQGQAETGSVRKGSASPEPGERRRTPRVRAAAGSIEHAGARPEAPSRAVGLGDVLSGGL
jgi:hypothetical protein